MSLAKLASAWSHLDMDRHIIASVTSLQRRTITALRVFPTLPRDCLLSLLRLGYTVIYVSVGSNRRLLHAAPQHGSLSVRANYCLHGVGGEEVLRKIKQSGNDAAWLP